MISEKCDLDEFIEAIRDKPYHEVLTLTLREGYASDDVLIHRKNENEGADQDVIRAVSEYNRAIQDFVFLLQVGETPDFGSEIDRENYQKFRTVAENLVKKGELLPRILDHFDD